MQRNRFLDKRINGQVKDSLLEGKPEFYRGGVRSLVVYLFVGNNYFSNGTAVLLLFIYTYLIVNLIFRLYLTIKRPFGQSEICSIKKPILYFNFSSSVLYSPFSRTSFFSKIIDNWKNHIPNCGKRFRL